MSDIVLPLYSIISQCHAFNTKMFYVSKVLNDRVLRNIIDGGGGYGQDGVYPSGTIRGDIYV